MAARDELRYDKRLIDRNLRKGDLNYVDHNKYLEDLPDVADKGAEIEGEQLMKEALQASDRMRERIKTQPQGQRRALPTPTTSFEDEEYADITPEGASE